MHSEFVNKTFEAIKLIDFRFAKNTKAIFLLGLTLRDTGLHSLSKRVCGSDVHFLGSC